MWQGALGSISFLCIYVCVMLFLFFFLVLFLLLLLYLVSSFGSNCPASNSVPCFLCFSLFLVLFRFLFAFSFARLTEPCNNPKSTPFISDTHTHTQRQAHSEIASFNIYVLPFVCTMTMIGSKHWITFYGDVRPWFLFDSK